MAGILNKKQRILDGLITNTGRRQLASGQMKIEFASFSDGSAFYASSDNKTADDANSRLYFEASDLPRDTIIPETDAFGDLEVFRGDQYTLFNGLPYVTGSSAPTSGSINLLAGELTNFSFQNFYNQNIIGTRIPYREKLDQTFSVSNKNIEFTISDEMDFINDMWLENQSLENLDDLFNDKKFGHLDVFKYLPPRYLLQSQTQPAQSSQELGSYSNISSNGFESLDEVYSYLSAYPYQEIEFLENSTESNLLGQIIFYNNEKIGKLAVIDIGEFKNNDQNSIGTRILFVGKFYRDRIGNLKFANIFTLVFE